MYKLQKQENPLKKLEMKQDLISEVADLKIESLSLTREAE